MNVYIRPLKEEDATVSCLWRNDPDVWKYTDYKTETCVTEEMELVWIRRVLRDSTAKRYAICTEVEHEYVGNVQLTDIDQYSAQFHIFIGNKSCWHKGVASKATRLMLNCARNDLKLRHIYLYVHKDNIGAIRLYLKNGFTAVHVSGNRIRMEIDNSPD